MTESIDALVEKWLAVDKVLLDTRSQACVVSQLTVVVERRDTQ